ncbi:hypothetical protein GCM10010299_54820 [Streptomyces tanashiensis]|nr:hypothetical protein GCM10010299_54820 [Streptomyces tanashiensis]
MWPGGRRRGRAWGFPIGLVAPDAQTYCAVNRRMPVRRIRRHPRLSGNVVPHLPGSLAGRSGQAGRPPVAAATAPVRPVRPGGQEPRARLGPTGRRSAAAPAVLTSSAPLRLWRQSMGNWFAQAANATWVPDPAMPSTAPE